MTTFADEIIEYDSADEHLTTTIPGETVSYLRDATGRIVQRTVSPVSGSPEVERYTYAGGGDSALGCAEFDERTAATHDGVPGE